MHLMCPSSTQPLTQPQQLQKHNRKSASNHTPVQTSRSAAAACLAAAAARALAVMQAAGGGGTVRVLLRFENALWCSRVCVKMSAAKSSRAPGGSADPRIHLNDQICQKVVHMYQPSDADAPPPGAPPPPPPHAIQNRVCVTFPQSMPRLLRRPPPRRRLHRCRRWLL